MGTRFTRLVLSNWRNFKSVDIPLGARSFVVGPNASGKTNLLDAFRFLRDIAKPGGGLAAAVEERRGFKHLRSLHAGHDSKVLLQIGMVAGPSTDEWQYTLELSGQSRTGQFRVQREEVRHGDEIVVARKTREEPDARLATQTHLEQISKSLAFRPLADALAGVVDVHVVPQVVRTPARAEEFSRHDAPGSDFILQLARLSARQQKRALRRIEKLLRSAVPRFSGLNVVRDQGSGRPHLEARYEHWRRRGAWQNEQEFSDGTLRLVGLLWAIDTGATPLLLEEPELSLHREIIRQLPRLFAAAAQRTGCQVIVSTHAEEMFDDRGVDPSEIVLLEPSEHETTVTVGSSRQELLAAARHRVPLGRLVTSLTKPGGVEQLPLALRVEPST